MAVPGSGPGDLRDEPREHLGHDVVGGIAVPLDRADERRELAMVRVVDREHRAPELGGPPIGGGMDAHRRRLHDGSAGGIGEELGVTVGHGEWDGSGAHLLHHPPMRVIRPRSTR